MRTFEVIDSDPFFFPLLEYKVHRNRSSCFMLPYPFSKSNKPAAGIACVPKRNLNVMECEIGTSHDKSAPAFLIWRACAQRDSTSCHKGR